MTSFRSPYIQQNFPKKGYFKACQIYHKEKPENVQLEIPFKAVNWKLESKAGHEHILKEVCQMKHVSVRMDLLGKQAAS